MSEIRPCDLGEWFVPKFFPGSTPAASNLPPRERSSPEAPTKPPIPQPATLTPPQHNDILRRAALWLAKCDPAVKGEGGHNKLLWACQGMVNGFLLTNEEAYELLARVYNPGCTPPWDLSDAKEYREFRRKIDQARANPPRDKPPGWLRLDTSNCDKFFTNLVAKYKIRDKESELKGVEQQALDGIHYPSMTAAELMNAKFDIRYLVKGILVAGQPCLLGGPKKCLKTSVIVDLGISLTTGGYFLGKFRVPQAVTVAIMSGESGMATIQETIRRISKTATVDPHKLDRLLVTEKLPQLGDPAHLLALQAFITEHAIEVLIIDPTYLAMPGADAGNLFVQGGLLRGISGLCAEHKVTVILAHHTKKNTADPHAIPELDNLAWAGFAEFARQWIMLGRLEAFMPGTGEHKLWLTAGGSAGHSGAWGLDVFEGSREDEGGRVWETTVTPAGKVFAAAKEAKKQVKILSEKQAYDDKCKKAYDWLCSRGEGATKSKIGDATGISHSLMDRVIETLCESGSIEPCKVAAKNSREYDGYRAVKEPEAAEPSQQNLFD